VSTHGPLGATEWRCLELVASGESAACNHSELHAALATGKFHVGEMLEQGAQHNLMPSVATALLHDTITGYIPHRLKIWLQRYVDSARDRARRQTEEALHIARLIREARLPVVYTKGVVLQLQLYGGLGGRTFSDIDLLTQPEHRAGLLSLLTDMGYVLGEYDWTADIVRPLPRRTELIYALSPDHVPHVVRQTGDPGLPYLDVDVAMSLTWHDSDWQVALDEALAHTITVVVPGQDGGLPTLKDEYAFIFTALHLFREGWFQRTIESKGLALGQFADVVRFWESLDGPSRAATRQLVERHALERPMAWVAAHTDSLFGSSITSGLLLDEAESPPWLHSARGMRGEQLQWTGSMRDRLRAKAPPRLTTAV
jgi:hypothetical protein